jgi:hypothetical protein
MMATDNPTGVLKTNPTSNGDSRLCKAENFASIVEIATKSVRQLLQMY